MNNYYCNTFNIQLSTESLQSTLISSYETFKGLATGHMKSKPATVMSISIGNAVSLLFHTLAKLLDHIPDAHFIIKTKAKEQSEKLIKKICNMTAIWLMKKYGKMFGSPPGQAILCCAAEELKVA